MVSTGRKYTAMAPVAIQNKKTPKTEKIFVSPL